MDLARRARLVAAAACATILVVASAATAASSASPVPDGLGTETTGATETADPSTPATPDSPASDPSASPSGNATSPTPTPTDPGTSAMSSSDSGAATDDAQPLNLAVELPHELSVTGLSKAYVLRTYRIRGMTSPEPGRARVYLQTWNGSIWVWGTSVDAYSGGSFSIPFMSNRAPLTRKHRVVAKWPDGGREVSGTWSTTIVPTADARYTAVSSADVPYSYRSGCPVGPSSLRLLQANHLAFDGRWKRGELVVAQWAVTDLTGVLNSMAIHTFPVREMVRVDKYRGSDIASMEADNTSAFNCRKVTGNPYRWSQHSWGDAIDVNPFENPYVTATRIYPDGSERYLNRSTYRTGMIMANGSVHRSFSYRGWEWGARWANPDYQHFSRNGR
jgi:hypothetical protein